MVNPLLWWPPTDPLFSKVAQIKKNGPSWWKSVNYMLLNVQKEVTPEEKPSNFIEVPNIDGNAIDSNDYEDHVELIRMDRNKENSTNHSYFTTKVPLLDYPHGVSIDIFIPILLVLVDEDNWTMVRNKKGRKKMDVTPHKMTLISPLKIIKES